MTFVEVLGKVLGYVRPILVDFWGYFLRFLLFCIISHYRTLSYAILHYCTLVFDSIISYLTFEALAHPLEGLAKRLCKGLKRPCKILSKGLAKLLRSLRKAFAKPLEGL